MNKIEQSTYDKVHKPFDVVLSKKGSIGFIKEVSINDCQEGFDDQVGYSVTWFKNVGIQKTAWWDHEELEVIGNFFRSIAKGSCHPWGGNARTVDKLI